MPCNICGFDHPRLTCLQHMQQSAMGTKKREVDAVTKSAVTKSAVTNKVPVGTESSRVIGWRRNNPEKYREYMREYMREHKKRKPNGN